MSSRLPVRKTYKLFIGGAFVRSESGRYDRIEGDPAAAGVNIPRGSRKDVRDAVAAGRKALPSWAARTAYNRGQILYRFAEALESRAADIGAERADVEASIDVLVHYAGWTDKFQPVLGGINPVAAPFLSFSLPEPTGVVGVVALAVFCAFVLRRFVLARRSTEPALRAAGSAAIVAMAGFAALSLFEDFANLGDHVRIIDQAGVASDR